MEDYSFDPSLHVADLQIVKKILPHFQIFSPFVIALEVFWTTKIANDILIYYLHVCGMYNWNLLACEGTTTVRINHHRHLDSPSDA